VITGSYDRCPQCGFIALLDTQECSRCSTAVGFHWPSLSLVVLDAGSTAASAAVEVDGHRWERCANSGWGCNWLVGDHEHGARCFSCRLTRRAPDADDTVALEMVAQASVAKRRLLVQLFELGLPITPYYEREGGLAFDLLKSDRTQRVVTGHANGVITIDVSEALDLQREKARIHLGEAYRTMLGHFRHEIGHYYQWVLVVDEPVVTECRALFGDERASYSDAIARHYKVGAPDDWAESFISEYATMHPWEDFAETWAHYLHITGTLKTTAMAALELRAERAPGVVDHDIVPRRDYSDASIDELLDHWAWMSLLFNRVNQAMGRSDLYPFEITPPVAEKLGFVHRLVTSAR